MILLLGQNELANVIHVVMGPETEAWMDLHGGAAVNVTEMLPVLDRDKPVYLHVTRCADEPTAAEFIKDNIESGADYPFAPPTTVFTPNFASSVASKQPKVPAPASAPLTPPPAVVKKPMNRGECSLCHAKSVELVPHLEPPICYGCVKIDLHLANKWKEQEQQKKESHD